MKAKGIPWLVELFLEALVWALAESIVALAAWGMKQWRKKRKKKERES